MPLPEATEDLRNYNNSAFTAAGPNACGVHTTNHLADEKVLHKDGFPSQPPTPPQSTSPPKSTRKRGRDESNSKKPLNQKRKIHRPKVVIDYGAKKKTPDKPKKIPKAATNTPKPLTPTQSPPPKRRKYVRRKLKTSGESEGDVQVEVQNEEHAAKPSTDEVLCKRSLNFDVETQVKNDLWEATSQKECWDEESQTKKEPPKKFIYYYRRRCKRLALVNAFHLDGGESTKSLGPKKLPCKKRRTRKTRRAKTSLELVSPTKDQMRAALIDPEHFRCVIDLGALLKSKRRRRTTRRRRLFNFTQLPSVSYVEILNKNLDPEVSMVQPCTELRFKGRENMVEPCTELRSEGSENMVELVKVQSEGSENMGRENMVVPCTELRFEGRENMVEPVKVQSESRENRVGPVSVKVRSEGRENMVDPCTELRSKGRENMMQPVKVQPEGRENMVQPAKVRENRVEVEAAKLRREGQENIVVESAIDINREESERPENMESARRKNMVEAAKVRSEGRENMVVPDLNCEPKENMVVPDLNCEPTKTMRLAVKVVSPPVNENPKVFLDQGGKGYLKKLLIDGLSKRFGSIHISERHQLGVNGRAVVLVENNRNIVQYDSKKSKKEKARVHLDPETMRVWNLWMKNEQPEEIDQENEKWWEQERARFFSVVEPFVILMRKTLGNRKFSPWKGSVTDSVAGVYLTQNVGDTLSSGAFMTLVQHFPYQFASKHIECLEYVEKECSPESVGSSNTPADVHTQIPSEEEKDFMEEQHTREDDKPLQKESLVVGDIVSSPIKNKEDQVSGEGLEEAAVSTSNQWVEDNETLEFKSAGNIVLDIVSTEMEKNDNEVCGVSCCLQEQVGLVEAELVGERETVESNKPDPQRRRAKVKEKKEETPTDWDELRKKYWTGRKSDDSPNTMDRIDWDAVRRAPVDVIAKIITNRGMNNVLGRKIKEFLDRMVKDHGSTDLEWLRDVPPEKAKEFLMSIGGIGLKSTECLRLLALHQVAFPVDTNVARVAVRLGWVPIQPLPGGLEFHDLDVYPIFDDVQKYLWTRLRHLDHHTLYELHYVLITFGKVFCTKRSPNCSACPMQGSCKHYASARGRATLKLPEPKGKSPVDPDSNNMQSPVPIMSLPNIDTPSSSCQTQDLPDIEDFCQPQPLRIVRDMDEDYWYESDDDEIPLPTAGFNMDQFTENCGSIIDGNNIPNQVRDLVVVDEETANIPLPKLKTVARLRTVHLVYEIPDSHPLLSKLNLDPRDPGDPSPYLFAIWTTDEKTEQLDQCKSREAGASNEIVCSSFGNIEQQNLQTTIRGTVLIPCRTANKGFFPLNGTYFQSNEVFADDETSQAPIEVPTGWLWNLNRRYLYCGKATTNIFRGLSLEEIQHAFEEAFICVRGFNRRTLSPKSLAEKFHIGTAMGKKKKI